jgi:pyridoxamine 5'-phosphate oxidase
MTESPGPDPIALLIQWHADAARAGSRDPDAMALATATATGEPSVRTVLFKGAADGKIRFVTNYLSRKASEIEANPRAALVFYWPELMRQVRVEGTVQRAPAETSDAYFASRSRESQLGAWASPQSRPIGARSVLDQAFAAAEERFRGGEVARPAHWGVYLVEPARVQLWFSAPHRLHDCFLYERSGQSWTVQRLAP